MAAARTTLDAFKDALDRVEKVGLRGTGATARELATLSTAPPSTVLSPPDLAFENKALSDAAAALRDANERAFGQAVMKVRTPEVLGVLDDVLKQAATDYLVNPAGFQKSVAEARSNVSETDDDNLATALAGVRQAPESYYWNTETAPADAELDPATKHASGELNPEKLHRMAHELALEVKAIHDSFCTEINKAQSNRMALNRTLKRVQDPGDSVVGLMELSMLKKLIDAKVLTCKKMKAAYNRASKLYESASTEWLQKGRRITDTSKRYLYSNVWLHVLCAFGKCIPDKDGDLAGADQAFTDLEAGITSSSAVGPSVKSMMQVARAITKVLDALNALPSKSATRHAVLTSSEMSLQMYNDLPDYDDINSSAYRVFVEYNTDELFPGLGLQDLENASDLKELSKAMERRSTKEQMAWWAAGRKMKELVWKLIVNTAKLANEPGGNSITLGQARELINYAVENLKRFGYNLTAEPAELPGFASSGAGGCFALRPGVTAPAHRAFEWGASHGWFQPGSYTINPQTVDRDGRAVEIRRLQQPVSVGDQLTGAFGSGSLVLEGFGPTSGETSLFGGPNADAASAWGAPTKGRSNVKTNTLPSFEDQDGVVIGREAIAYMTTGRNAGAGAGSRSVVRGVFDGPAPVSRYAMTVAETNRASADKTVKGLFGKQGKRTIDTSYPASSSAALPPSGLRRSP